MNYSQLDWNQFKHSLLTYTFAAGKGIVVLPDLESSDFHVFPNSPSWVKLYPLELDIGAHARPEDLRQGLRHLVIVDAMRTLVVSQIASQKIG